jgi:hypothetical protein
MNSISLDGKTNVFEKKVSEYNKSGPNRRSIGDLATLANGCYYTRVALSMKFDLDMLESNSRRRRSNLARSQVISS